MEESRSDRATKRPTSRNLWASPAGAWVWRVWRPATACALCVCACVRACVCCVRLPGSDAMPLTRTLLALRAPANLHRRQRPVASSRSSISSHTPTPSVCTSTALGRPGRPDTWFALHVPLCRSRISFAAAVFLSGCRKPSSSFGQRWQACLLHLSTVCCCTFGLPGPFSCVRCACSRVSCPAGRRWSCTVPRRAMRTRWPKSWGGWRRGFALALKYQT